MPKVYAQNKPACNNFLKIFWEDIQRMNFLEAGFLKRMVFIFRVLDVARTGFYRSISDPHKTGGSATELLTCLVEPKGVSSRTS